MAEPSEELLALHSATKLQDINYLRLHVEQKPGSGAEPPRGSAYPTYQLGVEPRDEGEFRIRLRVMVDLPAGMIDVEAAAEYVASDYDGEISGPLMVEYANEVGIMVLLPYLRQAIADLTQRVFNASLIMPIFSRGEVSFDPANAVSTPQ